MFKIPKQEYTAEFIIDIFRRRDFEPGQCDCAVRFFIPSH